MRKILIIIIILRISSIIACRTMSDCRKKCINFAIKKYDKDVTDCRKICREDNYYDRCIQMCIEDSRDRAFDEYDGCYDNCKLKELSL